MSRIAPTRRCSRSQPSSCRIRCRWLCRRRATDSSGSVAAAASLGGAPASLGVLSVVAAAAAAALAFALARAAARPSSNSPGLLVSRCREFSRSLGLTLTVSSPVAVAAASACCGSSSARPRLQSHTYTPPLAVCAAEVPE